MDRNRQENDPQRDRNSRVERVTDDIGGDNAEDLGRRQSEGNLGNERTRGGEDHPRRKDIGDNEEV